MSENETKEIQNNNQNKNSSHSQRGYHKHHNRNKNHRQNQQKNAEGNEKNSTQSQAQNQKNQANQGKNQNQNQKNNRQPSGDDRNKNDSQKRGSQKNQQKENKFGISQGFLDTAPDDDLIFGKSSSVQPQKKPSVASSEPITYREISDEELFGTAHIVYTPPVIEGPTVEIVGVRFKVSGKTYYFDPNGLTLKKGSHVIVETSRGIEFGEVCISNTQISENDIVPPLQKVCRVATRDDYDRHTMNKEKEKEAFKLCLGKIADHGLDMNLIDVQCSFDNSKLLFYFTSAGRVDFRELVRDLASLFKTRIELRQIGIRDEAKLIGGIGICGRAICCSRYLSNFAQVSIKMAKEQGLSLSSNKISGNCGRLMCCLNFENQTYVDEIKRTPMPGSVVKIGSKTGTVTDANPLTGMLKVKIATENENEIVSTHRDSVVLVSKKTSEPEEESPSEQ